MYTISFFPYIFWGVLETRNKSVSSASSLMSLDVNWQKMYSRRITLNSKDLHYKTFFCIRYMSVANSSWWLSSWNNCIPNNLSNPLIPMWIQCYTVQKSFFVGAVKPLKAFGYRHDAALTSLIFVRGITVLYVNNLYQAKDTFFSIYNFIYFVGFIDIYLIVHTFFVILYFTGNV